MLSIHIKKIIVPFIFQIFFKLISFPLISNYLFRKLKFYKQNPNYQQNHNNQDIFLIQSKYVLLFLRFLFSAYSSFLRFLSSLLAELPNVVGLSFSAKLCATCPRCNYLTLKICFTARP
eukprot:TRINITY_DN23042_c4_g1_i1.p2 TRINITY_DN23042_c4_g1~~TRINITY_DN23042_c4_g1_i1.p2  ORF type:complete len:138 (+),score=4.91 TRINITY_DN23042_c4_g1_i1:59-415(+)